MYIFYNSTTGKIGGETGYDTERDDSAITKLPTECDSFLWVDDPTTAKSVHEALFNYTIQAGAPLYNPAPDADKLEDAKIAKLAELDAACEAAIATFQSDALASGTMCTYLSDSDSMTLLNGEYSFINGPDYNGTDLIPWFVLGQNYVNHTAAQFRKVYVDGRAWFQTQKVKKSQLEAQVQAISLTGQTLDLALSQLNAINW